MRGETGGRGGCARVEMGEDGCIACRQVMRGRALALMARVAGEIHLGIGHLDDLKRAFEAHGVNVPTLGRVRQNEQPAAPRNRGAPQREYTAKVF